MNPAKELRKLAEEVNGIDTILQSAVTDCLQTPESAAHASWSDYSFDIIRGPVKTFWSDSTPFWFEGDTDGTFFDGGVITADGKDYEIAVQKGRGHRFLERLEIKEHEISEDTRKALAEAVKATRPEHFIYEDEEQWKRLLYEAWGGEEAYKKDALKMILEEWEHTGLGKDEWSWFVKAWTRFVNDLDEDEWPPYPG